MRSDRADAAEAEGIVSRQFVKGAMSVEEVTLGSNFAANASVFVVE